MKKIAIFLLSMVIAVITTGQNQRMAEESTIVHPEFSGAGNMENIRNFECIVDYLKEKIQYPEESILCKKFGTEVVRFSVTPAGELTNFRIINSVCPKMNEEVIRVLKTTNGQWHSGSVNGEPVTMEKEVAIAFKLNETDDFTEMASHYLKHGNELLFAKANPKKALKFFDLGINLLPNNENLLYARALCRSELGDMKGADHDWNRLKELGYLDRNISRIESLTMQ